MITLHCLHSALDSISSCRHTPHAHLSGHHANHLGMSCQQSSHSILRIQLHKVIICSCPVNHVVASCQPFRYFTPTTMSLIWSHHVIDLADHAGCRHITHASYKAFQGMQTVQSPSCHGVNIPLCIDLLLATGNMCPSLDACREELEFIANTLIFILAGVIIAGNVYLSQHSSSSPVTIRGREYGYAFLLWIVLLVSHHSQVWSLHSTCKVTRVKTAPQHATLHTAFCCCCSTQTLKCDCSLGCLEVQQYKPAVFGTNQWSLTHSSSTHAVLLSECMLNVLDLVKHKWWPSLCLDGGEMQVCEEVGIFTR